MLQMVNLTAASAILAGMFVAQPAYADDYSGSGSCNITASSVSGSYGFSGKGISTETNAFGVPVGPVAQTGVYTITINGSYSNTLRGTFSATISQLDASGYTPTISFAGTAVFDLKTCQSDYTVTSFNGQGLPSPFLAFHAVSVDGGKGVRAISTVDGLVADYPTITKLN
jgi:hypothetical protein